MTKQLKIIMNFARVALIGATCVSAGSAILHYQSILGPVPEGMVRKTVSCKDVKFDETVFVGDTNFTKSLAGFSRFPEVYDKWYTVQGKQGSSGTLEHSYHNWVGVHDGPDNDKYHKDKAIKMAFVSASSGVAATAIRFYTRATIVCKPLLCASALFGSLSAYYYLAVPVSGLPTKTLSFTEINYPSWTKYYNLISSDAPNPFSTERVWETCGSRLEVM